MHGNYWKIKAMLEIKTTSAYSKKYWANGPHDYAFAQIQHYLLMTGLDMGYAACLIGGQQFVSYPVPRDNEYIARLLKRESEFWKRIENRDAPTPDMMCADVPEAMARLARMEGREVTPLIKPASMPRASKQAQPKPETKEVEPEGRQAVTIGGVTFYR